MKKLGLSLIVLLVFIVIASSNVSAEEQVVFEHGDRSEKIQEFKLQLVGIGFADWNPPTTYFGNETKENIIEFQKYYDTNRTDGVVDEETLTKIEEEYNT
ncbi:peptidoglycan-binding domain-containing protein, partial [Alkalibacillus haloalkaliphilus]|uniref:peptidoglycan-binding domain-containing protein n=1 Tax=Alkalibacillus haloalkaliphilus TaxID=94136 RepID=UPI0029363978